MRISAGATDAHLSYCTNVHPGVSWHEHFAELQQHVPEIRRRVVVGDEPFGLGLRVSAEALAELESPSVLENFQDWLAREGLYVFTLNGFPYGVFHGKPVKSDVYRPDWSEPERLDYTCRLASLLARLDPPDAFGSISTLPGTFAAWTNSTREQAIVENLLKAVSHCITLERETGVRIAIAIEPEPCCLLETVEQTVRFFEQRLLSMKGIARLVSYSGLAARDAREAVHRHLGVCHDACHSAVEFEHPVDALARYEEAGIDVVKLQLSSALRVSNVNESALRRLERFDEPVYLHQVIERCGDTLVRHEDLRIAIDAMRYRLERRSTLDTRCQLPHEGNVAMARDDRLWGSTSEPASEWRIHFHVPVHLRSAGLFQTTQFALEALLERQQAAPVSRHLEVETYTWNVLPPDLAEASPADSIAREIDWVRRRL